MCCYSQHDETKDDTEFVPVFFNWKTADTVRIPLQKQFGTVQLIHLLTIKNLIYHVDTNQTRGRTGSGYSQSHTTCIMLSQIIGRRYNRRTHCQFIQFTAPIRLVEILFFKSLGHFLRQRIIGDETISQLPKTFKSLHLQVFYIFILSPSIYHFHCPTIFCLFSAAKI